MYEEKLESMKKQQEDINKKIEGQFGMFILSCLSVPCLFLCARLKQ